MSLIKSVFNTPSLIVPGKGFLNKSGKDKEYTVEFWARINSTSIEPKRIFGPISSDDGLYVDGEFITLVIGNKFASYFVGEWYRPMLINIKLIRNNATVVINGEQVINLDIVTNELNLPDILDIDGKEQDWLGFYSYKDVNPVEIDCIAIYPYSVPTPLAKKRFIYGQGVPPINTIDSVYSGKSVSIDYTFADYTTNYSYPDFANWNQGSYDNLLTTSKYISAPQYSLPNIFLDTKTTEELYETNNIIQSGSYKYITFKPTLSANTSTASTGWTSVHGYFNFPDFNILNEEIRSIYMLISNDGINGTSGTLFKIKDKTNNNYLRVYLQDNAFYYDFTYNDTTTTLYVFAVVESNIIYTAGFDIPTITERFGGNLVDFFGNKNNLEIYVGGDDEKSNTFYGKIYSFNLCTNLNYFKINPSLNLFDTFFSTIPTEYSYGFTQSLLGIDVINFTSSYSLKPKQEFDNLYLDIDVAGYWQDYMPLSYFGQYVKDSSSNDVYNLDFIQYNVELPEKLIWTYTDLNDEFDSPLTYSNLNSYYSSWANYNDLSKTVNMENSTVKTYVTFQNIIDGANASDSNFTILKASRENSVIDLNNFSSWRTTKFEIANNTIIYPRSDVDFNEIAIVYSLDFNIKSILNKPFKFKNLQLCSQGFNHNLPNPVGTKFGNNIFPYTQNGSTINHKSKNPYVISKDSTPYLYSTKNSGIKLITHFQEAADRSINIPVGTLLADFTLTGLNMWIKYNEPKFPTAETEIFNIVSNSSTYRFYIKANSNALDRGRIYAKYTDSNQNLIDFYDIKYYWNGLLVEEPVLTKNEWGVLGLNFRSAEGVDNALSINVKPKISFNNLSFYEESGSEKIQSYLFYLWNDIKNNSWGSWTSKPWRDILYASVSEQFRIENNDIYSIYIGTNKIIIDDDQGMVLDSEQTNIYNNISWSTSIGTPV